MELIRGDSRTINITFKDAEGELYNLTGATVYLTINKKPNPVDDTSADLQKVLTDIENPTSGVATFRLSATDTEIDPGSYWFDAQLVDAEGNKLSRAKEKVTIISDITRS